MRLWPPGHVWLLRLHPRARAVAGPSTCGCSQPHHLRLQADLNGDGLIDLNEFVHMQWRAGSRARNDSRARFDDSRAPQHSDARGLRARCEAEERRVLLAGDEVCHPVGLQPRSIRTYPACNHMRTPPATMRTQLATTHAPRLQPQTHSALRCGHVRNTREGRGHA